MSASRGRLLIATTVAQTLRAFVLPQLPFLRAAGWEVMMVASSGEGSMPQSAGVATHEVAMTRSISPVADARSWLEWYWLLRRARPDVLLGSTPKAGLLSMTAGAAAGIEHRIFLHRGARWETMHGTDQTIMKGLERLTMSAATATLAVSNSLADLVVREGLTKARPVVLGHGGSAGVDLVKFSPKDVTGERPVTLGFVGRISRDKGVEVALDALSSLRRHTAGAVLLIAGEYDPTDPIETTLKPRLESEPGVKLMGRVDDIPSFMNGIDVLVFPSRREGLPNVVIEAAACGVPSVGWDVTGLRDAIEDGQTGSLVPLGNVQLFHQKVAEWATKCDDSTARSCRQWSTRFSRAVLAEALVEFLDELVRADKREPRRSVYRH